jgi:hypothetical protein
MRIIDTFLRGQLPRAPPTEKRHSYQHRAELWLAILLSSIRKTS